MQHARTARSVAQALALIVLALLLSIGGAEAQPKFPELTGRIVDEMGILTAADREELAATLRQLEGKSSDQIVVYVTKSLQGYPIEDFGYQLGRAWKIGQQGTNNGIVLIVAPNEKKVRIEVGRGLEPQMTDVMSGLIVQNAILPAFRRGDFPGGIKAGVRDIKDVLLGDAAEVEARAKSGKKRGQGGVDTVGLLFLLFWLAVFAFIFFMMIQQERRGRGPHGRGLQRNPFDPRYQDRGGGPTVIVIPGGWGGSSSWPGPTPNPDAGWGGGGGDFGGGGASGSWD
ncbi:MAG: hypothetical protein RL291_1732 [Pseudomonadota bacterium]